MSMVLLVLLVLLGLLCLPVVVMAGMPTMPAVWRTVVMLRLMMSMLMASGVPPRDRARVGRGVPLPLLPLLVSLHWGSSHACSLTVPVPALGRRWLLLLFRPMFIAFVATVSRRRVLPVMTMMVICTQVQRPVFSPIVWVGRIIPRITRPVKVFIMVAVDVVMVAHVTRVGGRLLVHASKVVMVLWVVCIVVLMTCWLGLLLHLLLLLPLLLICQMLRESPLL